MGYNIFRKLFKKKPEKVVETEKEQEVEEEVSEEEVSLISLSLSLLESGDFDINVSGKTKVIHQLLCLDSFCII